MAIGKIVYKLLSIEDVALLLGLKKSTIYKYVCSKQIDYIKIGSRVRFKEEDIYKFIENRKVKAINA